MGTAQRLSSAFSPVHPRFRMACLSRSIRRRNRSKEPKQNPSDRLALTAPALIAALFLAGIGGWWWVKRHETTPRPPPDVLLITPDVLLITIDTLRADATGAYGNRRG